MCDLIESLERALVDFSAGRIEQPVRTMQEFGVDLIGRFFG
jgi:hypothetical protein